MFMVIYSGEKSKQKSHQSEYYNGHGGMKNGLSNKKQQNHILTIIKTKFIYKLWENNQKGICAN